MNWLAAFIENGEIGPGRVFPGSAEAVEEILAGREFLRQTFHDVAFDFIKHQRQHMDKEERLLFPAAVQRLRPEDWAAIDARLEDRKDPLFNGAVETKFQALQRTILRWQRETETSRAKTASA